MSIFTFITQEQIDELPDNPQRAFLEFVRICQGRLSELTPTEIPDQETYDAFRGIQHSYMRVVLAAAQQYKVEPFNSMPVPRFRDFDINDFQEFKGDVEFFLAGAVLSQSSRAKKDSVLITPHLKDTLKTYTSNLRRVLEESIDIDEAKRSALLQRLDEFENELERKRLNLLTVAMVAITFLGAPGSLGSSAEIANKLFANILHEVHEARNQDDTLRALASTEPLKLSAPTTNTNSSTKSDRLWPSSRAIAPSSEPPF